MMLIAAKGFIKIKSLKAKKKEDNLDKRLIKNNFLNKQKSNKKQFFIQKDNIGNNQIKFTKFKKKDTKKYYINQKKSIILKRKI